MLNMLYLVLFALILSFHEDTGWNSGFYPCSWEMCLDSWLKIEESKSLAIVYCLYYCDNAGLVWVRLS